MCESIPYVKANVNVVVGWGIEWLNPNFLDGWLWLVGMRQDTIWPTISLGSPSGPVTFESRCGGSSLAQTNEDSGVIGYWIVAFSLIDVSHDNSVLSKWASESLDSSVVQGECGHNLGEVTEPLFETEAGSPSSSESVLVGGVAIWLGGLVVPHEDLSCFKFPDPSCIESDDRLWGTGRVKVDSLG